MVDRDRVNQPSLSSVLPNIPIKVSSPKPKALDLFSGTGSVSKRLLELGYEVTSLDVNKGSKPTLLCDILQWKYKEFPSGHFQLIAASPPCTEYSTAKSTAPRNLEAADQLVLLTLEIIRYFQPEFWWLENPRGGLLKSRPFMEGIPFVDVDYCQFSDWGYQKPTRIWGHPQISKLKPKLCNPFICPNVYVTEKNTRKHREALGVIT
jgi:hypothetical protein